MNRRLLGLAVLAMVLFIAWTAVVRAGISDGTRSSVVIARPFDDWPETVTEVRHSSDIQHSIFVSFGPPSHVENGSISQSPPDMFGRPVIGSVIDNNDNESINGTRYVTGLRAGVVSSISVFVAGPVDDPPHNQFQLAIYHDASGAPGRLLAATASGTLAPDQWNSLPIAARLEPRTPYWLMYNNNGSNGTVNNPTYTPLSSELLDDFIRAPGSWSNRRIDMMSGLGGITPTAVAVAIIGLVAARRSLRSGLAIWIGFAVALGIGLLLRVTLFAPFGSYPSGHALRSVYVAIVFAAVVPRRLIWLAGGLVVFAVCVMTIYVEGHFSDEIIGGLLLGWAVGTAVRALVVPARRRVTTPEESLPVDDDGRIGLTAPAHPI
jgi:hypothetical protein